MRQCCLALACLAQGSTYFAQSAGYIRMVSLVEGLVGLEGLILVLEGLWVVKDYFLTILPHTS